MYRSVAYRAAVAGAVAGPTILLTGVRVRHDELALYLLLRGITLLVRIGNKPSAPRLIHKALTLTRWQHGDTALMCIACWQILNCYLLNPKTLPPSFIRFLDKMAGFAPWFIPLARVRSTLLQILADLVLVQHHCCLQCCKQYDYDAVALCSPGR
jgi:hypothetical protein